MGKSPIGGRTPLYRVAGLEFLGGKSRRYRVAATGETISERQGKKRIAEISPAQRKKEQTFGRILTRTGSVERARQESGLSKRGFERVRAKTAVKKKGRYSFLRESTAPRSQEVGGGGGARHRWTVVQPSGGYRTVWFDDAGLAAAKRHREAMGKAYRLHPGDLIRWLRDHPGGRVRDADGHWVHFLTDVDPHHEAMERMSKPSVWQSTFVTVRNRARLLGYEPMDLQLPMRRGAIGCSGAPEPRPSDHVQVR
jgi:hypothetical protein